jgi:hypothetical protein
MSDSLDLDHGAEAVDFAPASTVIQEVTDPAGVFSDLSDVWKPEERVLIIEP